MVKMYHKTPSEILKINDEYIAYCLDEAMTEFIYRIENGEKPRFEIKNKDRKDNPGLKMLLGQVFQYCNIYYIIDIYLHIGGDCMKKIFNKISLLFVLILSFTLIALVGCAPKEDPQEVLNTYYQSIKDGKSEEAYETLCEQSKKISQRKTSQSGEIQKKKYVS